MSKLQGLKNMYHRMKGDEPVETPVEVSDYVLNFNLDSPNAVHVSSRTVHVEGWIIPVEGRTITSLRIRNNDTYHTPSMGKERPDVMHLYPDRTDVSLNSGFYAEIDIADGHLSIEVEIGGEYKELISRQISYTPEVLVDMLVDPNLSLFSAEHENSLNNKRQYYFEDNQSDIYHIADDDVKLVSFYLPQYHPIEENNRAWGEGFTEWTNVTSAKPRFVGHLQPNLPGALGFYDLRVSDSIKKQIDLAKQHGIYGFCIYYYWFSGKKILDSPLNTLIAHKEWNFNFSICWANENWTKRWDGRDSEVIIAQEYKDTDPLEFIRDVEHILLDERYIKHDSKPVLTVYRASELKDPRRYVDVWRQYFRDTHNKELYLVACMGFDTTDPREYGFDIGLDFAPQTSFLKKDIFPESSYPYMTSGIKYLDRNFSGSIVRYSDIALNAGLNRYYDFPTIRSVSPAWDNDSRRKGTGFVMYGANSDLYAQWLDAAIVESKKENVSQFIFINAWNEWAEGAILEPDAAYGFANLNSTTRTLASHSSEANKMAFLNTPYDIKKHETMIHVHVSSLLTEEDIQKISFYSDESDVHITYTLKYGESVDRLKSIISGAHYLLVPDRGRSILPFVFIISRLTISFKSTYTLASTDIASNDILKEVDISITDEPYIKELSNTSIYLNEPAIMAVKKLGLVVEDFDSEIGDDSPSTMTNQARSAILALNERDMKI